MALAEPPVDRKARAALIGGPALLALGLCLIDITGRSLGFDESATVAIAAQHGAALRHAIAHDGGNMSGYYVLMHVLVGWFGNGEVVLRLPSAIGSAIATGLTSALALRLFDRRVAFAAGVLMAVSLPMVFWGQSARSYAILVALTAASFLALDVAQKEGGRAAWGAYVITTALALYASLLAVLIIVAQLLVMDRRRLRTPVSAVAAVAACSIPLIVLAARRGSGQLFWVPRPDWTAVKQVLQALTSSGLEPSIHTTSTTYVLLVLTVVMLIVAIVAARDSALLRSWLLTPVLFALVESFVGQPIFLPRNLLIVLPAVAILLASAVTRWRPGWALLVAVIALRALQLAPAYGVSPEDWRAATAYLLNHAQAGDCVAFYPADGRNAFRYYARARLSQAPRAVLPRAPWSSARAYIEDYATLSTPPTGCVRLWLVSSHQGQPDGPAASRANRARYVRLRGLLEGAYPRSDAKDFGYAAPVSVELFSTA